MVKFQARGKVSAAPRGQRSRLIDEVVRHFVNEKGRANLQKQLALGAEIQKTRPALILQNDIGNKFSPVTIVAAISSKFDEPLFPRKS